MSSPIDNLLGTNEQILVTANQSRVMPGGSMCTPDSIFVTNRRVVFRNPTWLGLKKEMIDFMFKDLANVKINKGIFTSQIELTPRFNNCEKLQLPAIPKKIADEIFSMIRKGISGEFESRNPVVEMAREDSASRLEKYASMLERGIISQEEFQVVKTKLLGEV